jgi:hypothetical protein
MRGAEPASDNSRLRLGLALCFVAATATFANSVMWLGHHLGVPLAPDTVADALWWIGAGAYAAGAAFVASACGSRAGGALAWVASVAFGVVLLAYSIGLGLRAAHGAAHEHATRLAIAWTTGSWWIGTAALAIALSRIGVQPVWARMLGAAAPAAIGLFAVAGQVASPAWGTTFYAVTFVTRVVGLAPTGILAVAAWRAARGTAVDARNERRPLADAVLALPIVLAVRGALQIAGWTAGAAPITVAPMDELLGLLTIGCVAGCTLAPGRLRSPRAWIALTIAVAGHATAVAAGDPEARLHALSLASFGVLGARAPARTVAAIDALAVAHVVGIGAVSVALLAIAALGGAIDEGEGARRVRAALGPLVVATAATIRLPLPSGEAAVCELVATGAFGLGTWRLWWGCLAIARAVRSRAPPTPVAADGKVDVGSPQEPALAPLPAAPATANPYAAPSSRTATSHGRLGSPKLAVWRARVRVATTWIALPPIACAVATNALAFVAALGGGPETATELFQATGHATGMLITPVSLSHVAARGLALGGVFAATQRPRTRVVGLGAWPRGVARFTAGFALAVWTSFAFLTIAYGASGHLAPWLGPVDDVAYAAAAFYGARLLAAGDRGVSAWIARVLAFAFLGLAAAEFLLLRGLDDWLTAMRVDAYGASALSLVAVAVLFSLRSLLRDDP